MEKIIELAHALGEEIAKSAEIKAVAAAKDAYEADADLQAKLAEYAADRKLLSDEFNKDEQDGGMIEDIKGRMDELSREIVKHPLYVAFADAQKAMNDLMTAVNDEIKFCITGERPSHCTHDCSTCGGCHG
mgnify:CR=1 FL=1